MCSIVMFNTNTIYAWKKIDRHRAKTRISAGFPENHNARRSTAMRTQRPHHNIQRPAGRHLMAKHICASKSKQTYSVGMLLPI